MKARKLLTFVLCFVLLVASFAVIASAKGAETTTPVAEVTNSDGSITTQYGNIPSKYADVNTYPFVVFKYKNGVLTTAETVGCNYMGTAFNSAKGWSTKNTPDGKGYKGDIYTSTILMRKDYTTVNRSATATSGDKGDKFDNWAQNEGLITLDLNGYTLTQDSSTSGLFYQVTTKGSSSQGYIFTTIYTVKNGNIVVNNNPVFYGNMWNSVYGVDGYSMADKDFIWNFDNVNFSYVSGANEVNMLMGYTGPQSTSSNPPSVAAPFYFNYNNCTFDLTNAHPDGVTLFNAAPSSTQYLKVTVTVTGCEVIANNLNKFTLCKTETKFGSSVTFLPDDNGNYITVTAPNGTQPTVPASSTYGAIDGKKVYLHASEVGATHTVFTLSECADLTAVHSCTCGSISSACVDENADNVCDLCDATKIGGKWITNENAGQYPFALLDASGNYKSVYTNFKSAVTEAAKIDGSTIVLRTNYTTTNVNDASNNLKALTNTFTVDLNGYTFTRGYNGSYLFDNWWDAATTADPVTVNFKNGTLVAEKWLFNLSGSSAIANEKTANFNFENVTFKMPAANDKNDGWIFAVHAQSYNKIIRANLVFTDCTFDMTDMRSSLSMSGSPALNLDTKNASGDDYVKVNVTFNGGKIVANRFETKAFCQTNSDDVVTYNKGTDGNYITLEMPEGKAPNTPATADYFVVGGANLYFHKNGNVYTLTECLDPATNHECTCGLFYSDCSDADKNHVCDVCGETSECIDENKDHICDLCDQKTPCEDTNNDHNCETCGNPVTVCVDDNKDHNCDICGKEISVCGDANDDGKCDVCGLYKYDLGKYGIFWEFTNYPVSEYPFFVLMYKNGVYTIEKASTNFYGAQSGQSAMGYAIYGVLRDNNRYDVENGVYVPEKEGGSVVTAVVVMRRDYNLKSGAEYHNNMAHMQGTTILDLNGFTLREAEGSTKSLINITAKGWNGNPDKNNGYYDYTFPCTLSIINGKMEVRQYAAVSIGTNDAAEGYTDGTWYIKNSSYTVNVEGVTFGLVEGATTTNLVYVNGGTSNSYPGLAKVNINCTDCVFDLKTNAITTDIVVFNNGTTKDVDTDVVVEGCEIIASDMSKVSVYTNSNTNGSTVVFKKGEDGKYITLTMPKGSVAPAVSNTVILDNGVVCAFVKASETADDVNYTVYPAVMVGYKIKTSVTLWSNFVYNIYIPKANVSSVMVNGIVGEYEEVEIDGVVYYHVAVNLPAGETLSDIALKVALVSGETTVDANWTLNVFAYTKAVLAGDFNDTTKTLMEDMLAYAAVAHLYFDNTESVSDKLDEIADILDGYNAAIPTGDAKQPTSNTYFTDVAVYLGAVPSFRFYLAEGYTADNFTFTVGERNATVTAGNDENGAYLEVVMYAYMMLDDVTYTVVGTDVTESYNLFAYYAYVQTLGNENLTAIVEGLMVYAASAKNYRDYVVENSCFHQYVNGTCSKCGEDDPNVGTMSLNVPEFIYSDYPGKDITVTFSKDWYNGEVTFTTNNENVYIENGKIFAKGNFAEAVDVIITATTAHHTVTAVVNVSTYNSTIGVETKLEYYEKNIIKEENKGGIIFVGDSYFDGVLNSSTGMPPFWNDFYTDWAGEKAFLMGMSSSQIHQLEIASERIVYPMEPTEIVVHIGHNDMHHGSLTPEEFVARLTALFNEYHRRLPGATIYYCSVDPKKAATPETHERHESSFVKAPAVNAAMKALAETTDWLVYVDTTYIFYGMGGTTVNTNMYPSADGSHPTLYAYDLIRYSINKARGVEVVGGQVMDADNHVTNITNEGMFFKDNNGKDIASATGNFVISGKLAITDMYLGNSHVQFRFAQGKRFLLHDSDGDGIFFAQGAAKTSEKYDANNGIVLEWAVVVDGTVAYLYINGKQEATLEVPSFAQFNIGVMDANVTVFDVKFSATTDADYADHVGKYTGERVYVEKFGNNQEIAKSGATYESDLAGNTLAGSNFIAKGKLQVYATNFSNPHLQFSFGNGYRFLVWDSDSDGLFGIGYRNDADGALISDKTTGEIYQAAKGGNLLLEWAVVVEDGKAYFYINGVLKATMTDPTYDANDPSKASFNTFNLGALQMNMLFYDIEIYAENGNAEMYNAAVAEYN